MTIKDKEKFISIIMLMPVILALDYAHPHYAVINLCERLVEPLVFAFGHHLGNINKFEMLVFDIQFGHVIELFSH
jgi:hypothetical protein